MLRQAINVITPSKNDTITQRSMIQDEIIFDTVNTKSLEQDVFV